MLQIAIVKKEYRKCLIEMGEYRSNSQEKLILRIITVILAVLLGALLWMNKVEEDKKSAELRALNKKLYQEEQEK